MPREETIAETLQRLRGNAFRRKFTLRDRELAHLQTWGIERVMRDAEALIRARVAPASPKNDGRQTPWRNYPVFVAQHATATCCRGCLEKWHGIQKGHELTGEELAYVLGMIRAYLESFVVDR